MPKKVRGELKLVDICLFLSIVTRRDCLSISVGVFFGRAVTGTHIVQLTPKLEQTRDSLGAGSNRCDEKGWRFA